MKLALDHPEGHSNLYSSLEMSEILKNCKTEDELLDVENCICFLLRNKYISLVEASLDYTFIKLRGLELKNKKKK